MGTDLSPHLSQECRSGSPQGPISEVLEGDPRQILELTLEHGFGYFSDKACSVIMLCQRLDEVVQGLGRLGCHTRMYQRLQRLPYFLDMDPCSSCNLNCSREVNFDLSFILSQSQTCLK